MRVWSLFLLVSAICAASAYAQTQHANPVTPPTEQPQQQAYQLAPDDIVSITVFGEPDLSVEKARVTTDGRLSLPLLGQVPVAGLSAAQLEVEITRRLADGYLNNPDVTVAITEYRLFYVNGEVKRPGGYSYLDGLTVHKAVTLAGGFSERASTEKITLIHEDQPNKPKAVGLHERLRPGDILTVGESFF